MIKMKYLFFSGLRFFICCIFKVLTSILLSQIQCLDFLKYAKIHSDCITLKTLKLYKIFDMGDFYLKKDLNKLL